MSDRGTFKITIDTGGTFTDLVLSADGRLLGLYKSPTTPADLFLGMRRCLDLAAQAQDLPVRELLNRTELLVYSTTVGTNAILSGHTPRVGLLVTKGHRDILLYKEGGKAQGHNLALPYPEPYVPRSLTLEIEERILADGTVLQPLKDANVRAQAQRLGELNVEAIAVCFLWSPINPAHEKRAGAIIGELLPKVELTLSHQINPIIREYRRASCAAIDVSIKALTGTHLADLDQRLREIGLSGEPVMVSHVSGGVLSMAEASERPVHTIDSGPALVPHAGLAYAAAAGEQSKDLVMVDAGGTSFDVSVTRGGNVVYTREKWLGERWSGHMTGLPAVDTRSIGAGGGSLAYVDAGGLLRVGPESAGADPGPACFGRGGARPTVGDAAVVLGYIDPHFFLGGALRLDAQLARTAVNDHIALPLKLTVEEAAEAILTLWAESMRGFMQELTIAQGIDPRESLIVGGGGAAGLAIVSIARELGATQVLIPKLAAGISAIGGQFSDVVGFFSRAWYATTGSFDFDGVNECLVGLEAEMASFLRRINIDGERRRTFVCEARYMHQASEIDVVLGDRGVIEDQQMLEKLSKEFDRVHKELFHVNQPGAELEITTWRGEARVVLPKPALPATSPSGAEGPKRTRLAYFDGAFVPTLVCLGESLGAGSIAGPAIIEEPTTTIVIPPGAEARVAETHYLIEVGMNTATAAKSGA